MNISPEDACSHIVCVGAVYIDTILDVPHFPIEDEKLRAKKLTKRRGGNTANSLEVLVQLLDHDVTQEQSTRLHLIAVLPSRESDAVRFIQDSVPSVDLDSCSIFRPDYTHPASSYIIQSQANLSRTIVSINELPELTPQEFISAVDSNIQDWLPGGWFHFEGRIPDVLLQCVQHLLVSTSTQAFKISVECEKPERRGMKEVAGLADVVFYSKIWAQKNGFENARSFLEAQRSVTKAGAILCCTWGADGATVLQKRDISPSASQEQISEWADVAGWKPSQDGDNGDSIAVDTIGAGDTFVAGMLYTLENRPDWPLQRKLDFANELAGRKVLQYGFAGLGQQMQLSDEKS